MATQLATSRRRENRLAKRKYYKEKKIVRLKEEFEKTKIRIEKMLPPNAGPFLHSQLFLEAKSCGIDLSTHYCRKKEYPRSQWFKHERDKGEQKLLPINDNSVCDWFLTLDYDQKIALYRICRKAFILFVDLKVEGLNNDRISQTVDFHEWGRIE